MKTIHKYRVQIMDEQFITMPCSAKLLAFQEQNGHPTLWALVDTNNKKAERRLYVFGTGNPADLPSNVVANYVGTIQDQHGLVWHLFDAGDW